MLKGLIVGLEPQESCYVAMVIHIDHECVVLFENHQF